MKKKIKKILSISFLVLILFIIVYSASFNNTYAYTEITDAASQTYDYVLSHLSEYSILANTSRGYTANNAYNVACIEVLQNGTVANNYDQYLQGYLIIKSNGYGYAYNREGELIYEIKNMQDTLKIAATMCYYVSEGFSEYSSSSYFSSTDNDLGYCTIASYGALRAWYFVYGSTFGFQTAFKPGAYSDNTYFSLSYWDGSNTASEKYYKNPYKMALDTYEDMSCEAIILAYQSGLDQSDAVFIGTNNVFTEPTINKYIYKTTNNLEFGNTRASYSDSQKKTYAPAVTQENHIRYKIVVTNNNSTDLDVTITDIMDNNLTICGAVNTNDVISMTFEDYGVNLTSSNNGHTVTWSDTIPANSSRTYKIRVEVTGSIPFNSSTLYANTATVTSYDTNGTKYEKSSSDYVKGPTITLTKAITKVETIVEETSESQSYSNRKNLSDSNKQSKAPYTTPGSIITYKITYKSDITCSYTLVDSHSSELSMKTGDFLNSSSKTVESTTSAQNFSFTMAVSSTMTATSTKTLYNTVTVDGTSITSSDYVKVEIRSTYTFTNGTSDVSLTVKKYITKVERGSTVVYDSTDRSDSENTTKAANPITVQKGDKITYTIEVTNTSNATVYCTECTGTCDCTDSCNCSSGVSGPKITSITIGDSAEGGLTLSDSSVTLSNIAAGASKSGEITATVTKSDMYLEDIENTATFSSGTYGQVVFTKKTTEYTYYVSVQQQQEDGSYTYNKEEREVTTVECSNTTSSTDISSNQVEQSTYNKDYVQLDDVDIAGDIWIDSDKDGIMDSGESAYSNVAVKLYRKGSTEDTWTLVDTQYPTSGHYLFSKVTKGDTAYSGNGTRKYADGSGYYSYYVEFEYWGIYYETTTYTPAKDSSTNYVTDASYTTNWNKQSHASELNVSTDNRTTFNNKFETVAYNTAYAGTSSSNSQTSLSYTRSSSDTHVVSLTEPTLSDLSSGANSGTIIAARSFTLFLDYGSKSATETEKCDYVEYLKHINLGLKTREQADLELEKDVYQAKLDINGKTTTYNYNGLGNGVYSGSYVINEPYELLIYDADYSYRTENYESDLLTKLGLSSSNDLQITLTYEITITNTSSYTVIPREVIDFSSSEMTYSSVSAYGNTGTFNVTDTSTYNTTANYSYSGYTTKFITGSGLEQALGKNQSVTFYMVYTVNKTDGAIILDNTSGDAGKVNIAQVGAFSAYSTYTESSKQAAGVVDGDSNPGDVNTTESNHSSAPSTTYYEDDTFQTSIKLLLRSDGRRRR